MQNTPQETVIVDLGGNIQYQVFVKDVEVKTETNLDTNVVEVKTEANLEQSDTKVVEQSDTNVEQSDTKVVEQSDTNVEQSDVGDEVKIITFISGASAKSRNGNLTQNKYQILASELSQELDGHKQLITDKMVSLDNSQKLVSELKSVIQAQNTQINEHSTKSQMYIDTIKDLQQKIDVLASQNGNNITDLESANDNLNNEMMVLQSANLKLHQERDVQMIEKNQLNDQYQKTLDLLSAKIKEVTLLQTESENFKKQVELYKESNDKLQQELDIVKSELAQVIVPVVPVQIPLGDKATLDDNVQEVEGTEPVEELERVVGNVRVQRNVRRANPPRRR